MNNKVKIAVIGGTDKSGKYLIKQLIEQGFQLKILLRNPDNFKVESPLIEVIQGDVTNYNSVNILVEGCQAGRSHKKKWLSEISESQFNFK